MNLEYLMDEGHITPYAYQRVKLKTRHSREIFVRISITIVAYTDFSSRQQTILNDAGCVLTWSNYSGWRGSPACYIIPVQSTGWRADGSKTTHDCMYIQRRFKPGETIQLESNQLLVPYELRDVVPLIRYLPSPPYFKWNNIEH